MKINFHETAQKHFDAASKDIRDCSTPVLELLSEGFRISWFREVEGLIWVAVVKPGDKIASQFGLQQEYFVVGNGYPRDFHRDTLKQEPPLDIEERIDRGVRFVASDVPVAEAYCAAWAKKERATVLVLKSPVAGLSFSEQLFKALGGALWRKDLFSEAEPVREPSEFFGREVVVNELLGKILVGSPVAVFGLRKIGKSSLLGRVEDIIEDDDNYVSATAFLIGNSTRLKSGRWWYLAQDILQIWQEKLQKFSSINSYKIHPKAERLSDAIRKNVTDKHTLAVAFERDITSLLKAARALQSISGRDGVRLIIFLDECDHLYPTTQSSGYWRADFFDFWNEIQSIKRQLSDSHELVYVLSGVNPSGVELGAILDQPNPLYEMQRMYLGPMDPSEANLLISGLGGRMGLDFDDEALAAMYAHVGGHPLLLRRLGTAVHENAKNRTSKKLVNRSDVVKAFNRKKRDLYNQVNWFVEHLAKVAPDEERLLRDIAMGGSDAYAELWEDNDFRETYAYHLERYGLVIFEDDIPRVSLSLIKDALGRPIASEFMEQKRHLKDIVETLEQAVRIRLKMDLERDYNSTAAVEIVVNSIPSDAKNRPLGRQDLLDLGSVAGLAGLLDSLNWMDYEILFDKMYANIKWIGIYVAKIDRLRIIKDTFKNAHFVRHNNDHLLKKMLDDQGYDVVYKNFSFVRDMLVS